MGSELGKIILSARKGGKKTLRRVAKSVGISASLLSLIENGKHIPPKEIIVRIARELDGNVDSWCGVAGMITPDAETKLAKLARDEPALFRRMVDKYGA